VCHQHDGERVWNCAPRNADRRRIEGRLETLVVPLKSAIWIARGVERHGGALVSPLSLIHSKSATLPRAYARPMTLMKFKLSAASS